MVHWNISGPHIQRNGGFARFFNLRKTAKEVILVLDNHGLDTELVLLFFGGEWDGKGLGQKKYQVFLVSIFLFGFLFPPQLSKNRGEQKNMGFPKIKNLGFYHHQSNKLLN